MTDIALAELKRHAEDAAIDRCAVRRGMGVVIMTPRKRDEFPTEWTMCVDDEEPDLEDRTADRCTARDIRGVRESAPPDSDPKAQDVLNQ